MLWWESLRGSKNFSEQILYILLRLWRTLKDPKRFWKTLLMSAFTFQQKANKPKKIAFALSLLLLMSTFTFQHCCPKMENITSALSLSLLKSTFTFQNCPKRKRLPWHFHFSAQKKEITLALGSRCSSPASRPPVADKPPVNLNPPGGNQPNTENITKSHCQALRCPQKVSLSNQRCQIWQQWFWITKLHEDAKYISQIHCRNLYQL